MYNPYKNRVILLKSFSYVSSFTIEHYKVISVYLSLKEFHVYVKIRYPD